jgi:hypothetical protein
MKTAGICALMPFLAVVSSVHPEAAERNAIEFDFDGELNEGAPVPWKVKSKTGTPRFKVVPVSERGGEKHLYLHSARSSFSLNRSVDVPVGPPGKTRVSWSWKAERLPEGPAADARVGSSCDQGLQVMLHFDGNRIISYVWDTNAPVGTVTEEGVRVLGFGMSIKVIVVQSGKEGIGRWSTIDRDVAKDFRDVFDDDPERVKTIRIQSNSQYTGTEGEGYFSPITFEQSGG